MTDQELFDQGFYEYRPTPFDCDGVETCFQKRYDDEYGKKYFINVKKWRAWKHPYTGEVTPPSYEYDVQLYKKDGHEAIDLLFHSCWTLSGVEAYLEKLWNTGMFEHYETFAEDAGL